MAERITCEQEEVQTLLKTIVDLAKSGKLTVFQLRALVNLDRETTRPVGRRPSRAPAG